MLASEKLAEYAGILKYKDPVGLKTWFSLTYAKLQHAQVYQRELSVIVGDLFIPSIEYEN